MRDESIILNIDRDSLYFTRDRSLHLGWRADYEGGVVVLTRENKGPEQVISNYRAIFTTPSGAVIAEGEGVDRVYTTGVDEVGSQEAVTNMWEKVQQEVDRFRLLMRLSTR